MGQDITIGVGRINMALSTSQDIQLAVTGGGAGVGSSSSPYTQPSRQRCYCPTCGRMLSQRRNLKQHLITTHKMTPDEATVIVKRCNLELLIDEPIIQPSLPPISLLPSSPLPLSIVSTITPMSPPSVMMATRSPLSS